MGKVVGILSMQKVINYGSFLQAYALKQLLLQNGADEVFFLDIEKGKRLPQYYNKVWLNKVKNIISSILNAKIKSKIKDRKFIQQLRNSIEIHINNLCSNKHINHFDIVFIGSDEVFNCCQQSTWGYTLQLYGNIPQADKIVTYAGSFGHTTYEQLINVGIANEIGETMKNKLTAISVRDQNSYEIVERLTGIKSMIHLDPVLIYGYKNYIMEGLCKNKYKKPYLIIYSYQGRIADIKEIAEIKQFAKNNKLKLLSIFCRYDWCDEAIIPNTPFEVLNWFKDSEYIITDTFHGTIFSIITHRPFCTLIRNSNRQKIDSLLKQISLEDRMISIDQIHSISSILHTNINYEKVEDLLNKERKRSIDFFKEQMKA